MRRRRHDEEGGQGRRKKRKRRSKEEEGGEEEGGKEADEVTRLTNEVAATVEQLKKQMKEWQEAALAAEAAATIGLTDIDLTAVRCGLRRRRSGRSTVRT